MYVGRFSRVSKPVVDREALAGLGRRFVALLIDGLLVVGLTLPARAAGVSGPALGALGLAVSLLTSVPLMAYRGQTVGMMVLRIRVLRSDDLNTPTLGNAFVRWVVFQGPNLIPLTNFALMFLSGAWVLMLLVTLLNDRWSRGFHDRVAGTVVVRCDP